jgi:hypothetical protein
VNQNDESALIGIVSAEPDYKISLSLNKKLKISLKSSNPVVLSESAGKENTFSRFSDHTGSQGVSYDLISNRHGKNFLLKKLKNVDYIFRVLNPDNEDNTGMIISSLRNMDCVTAVFSLDPGSLRDKNLRYIT